MRESFALAAIFGIPVFLLIAWAFYELAYGGGDPNSKDHNPPGGGF